MFTGCSLSESLILASIEPQYDKRLLFELVIKGRSILFNHFIDMRTTVICPFHVENKCFFGKFQQKHVISI